jgi:hypothetical protein
MNRFGPVLENLSFQNTRFDPDQTRFSRLTSEMARRSGTRQNCAAIPDCCNC